MRAINIEIADARQVCEYVVVPAADHSPATLTEEGVTPRVVGNLLLFAVGCAIDLNDQLFSAAGEISEIGADGELADELETVESPPSQCFP